MKEGTLISGCGTIHFNAETGRVLRCRLDHTFGKHPVTIDVEEWKKRYPAEHHLLTEEHDILDFGMWFGDGHYDGPAEDWRLEREEMLRAEAEVSFREQGVCAHLASMGL